MTELAHDGDRAARDVVALIGMRLGVGIAGLVNLLNPSVVVVGGGLVAAGEMLLEPARTVVRERALPPSRDVVSIVPRGSGRSRGCSARRCSRTTGWRGAVPAAERHDRLVVCPTPIGNLARRHPARPLGAP